jgi:hypothetical protein
MPDLLHASFQEKMNDPRGLKLKEEETRLVGPSPSIGMVMGKIVEVCGEAEK